MVKDYVWQYLNFLMKIGLFTQDLSSVMAPSLQAK
jgi:hypothetical protein